MALACDTNRQDRGSPHDKAHRARSISERQDKMGNHSVLVPSRKIKELRGKIWDKRMRNDMRLINDALKEIQAECVAVEIQRDNLERINIRLTWEINRDVDDVEVPF